MSVFFRLHVQAVRTKNAKQRGGRNAREGEEKEEKKRNRTVKQHPMLMFHGIPGRVNACEKCQAVFLLLFVLSHFMNQTFSGLLGSFLQVKTAEEEMNF